MQILLSKRKTISRYPVAKVTPIGKGPPGKTTANHYNYCHTNMSDIQANVSIYSHSPIFIFAIKIK